MIQNKRILILNWQAPTRQQWLDNYPHIMTAKIYRENMTKIERMCMRLSLHLPDNMRMLSVLNPCYFYGEWAKHISDYDEVIIIDELRGHDIFEFIWASNPKCRIAIFYDAPIKENSLRDPRRYEDLPLRFFTSDPVVADKYSIQFQPYFYIFAPDKEISPAKEQTDIFFLGEEKGDRENILRELAEKLDMLGIKHDFRLVGLRRRGLFRHGERTHNPYMPYDEMLSHVQATKAILELVAAGQVGVTQRVFEAIYFSKKLITNNIDIKRYDFYNPENIFILGEDSIDKLPKFLETPYKYPPPHVHVGKKQYSFESWLQGLLE